MQHYNFSAHLGAEIARIKFAADELEKKKKPNKFFNNRTMMTGLGLGAGGLGTLAALHYSGGLDKIKQLLAGYGIGGAGGDEEGDVDGSGPRSTLSGITGPIGDALRKGRDTLAPTIKPEVSEDPMRQGIGRATLGAIGSAATAAGAAGGLYKATR